MCMSDLNRCSKIETHSAQYEGLLAREENNENGTDINLRLQISVKSTSLCHILPLLTTHKPHPGMHMPSFQMPHPSITLIQKGSPPKPKHFVLPVCIRTVYSITHEVYSHTCPLAPHLQSRSPPGMLGSDPSECNAVHCLIQALVVQSECRVSRKISHKKHPEGEKELTACPFVLQCGSRPRVRVRRLEEDQVEKVRLDPESAE